MYDALILCGGLGTRFQSVSTTKPKGLAEIKGKPMLEIITDQLVRQGVSRILLCVGHLSNQVIEYYNSKRDAEYIFSIEDTPLGTGGAIQNAISMINTDPFIALNGDSFCKIDYKEFLNFHHKKNSYFSLVASRIEEASDYGTISLDSNDQILKFEEKAVSGQAVINAGIYLLPKDLFYKSKDLKKFSLEKELFPLVLSQESCFAFVVQSNVVDIGTKQRYIEAQVKIEY
ncbi:MAG: NTP transferase domain-containing protein [Leptospiraceae bacterium]|nr:NTP transferase domain-containing protein [Leptospiraceae bacterium]